MACLKPKYIVKKLNSRMFFFKVIEEKPGVESLPLSSRSYAAKSLINTNCVIGYNKRGGLEERSCKIKKLRNCE